MGLGFTGEEIGFKLSPLAAALSFYCAPPPSRSSLSLPSSPSTAGLGHIRSKQKEDLLRAGVQVRRAAPQV